MPPKGARKSPAKSPTGQSPKTELRRAVEEHRRQQTTDSREEQFSLQPISVFLIFFASHVVAAFFSPIQDCDETFNYWEPTHYLNHGYGFQTWEYSPEFAIRSWAYAGLHALLILPARLLAMVVRSKTLEFYWLRVVLGAICAFCETRLFSKISDTLNSRISIMFLGIMVTSPGMYHASIAYLPSSFTMYTTMLGMAAFMDWRGGLRTAQGISAIGLGALLGWPFAGAMALPFMIEEAFYALIGDFEGLKALFWRCIDGALRCFIILLPIVLVDSFFYRKLVIVPWNIVNYNVFSSKGPDLYGVEPWHFYLRNLLLNFGPWLLLALSSLPVLLLQHFGRGRSGFRQSYLRGIVFLSPFYLWLAIFTSQPHKEERFMYPAYPALALNAAICFHLFLSNLGSTDPRHFIAKIPVQLRFLAIIAFVMINLGLSAFRTLGTMTAYGAPLSIYNSLHGPNITNDGDTVCLGKEWYRFPTHFVLPDGVRAKFIKSEFTGLLPGEFAEAKQGFGFFSGTWLTPSGMNDGNIEDPSKYTDLRLCSFIVDSRLPSTQTTVLEPDYAADTETWEKVHCEAFLDATSTGVIGRLGWIPNLPFVPARLRRAWGEYCLLRRRFKR